MIAFFLLLINWCNQWRKILSYIHITHWFLLFFITLLSANWILIVDDGVWTFVYFLIVWCFCRNWLLFLISPVHFHIHYSMVHWNSISMTCLMNEKISMSLVLLLWLMKKFWETILIEWALLPSLTIDQHHIFEVMITSSIFNDSTS